VRGTQPALLSRRKGSTLQTLCSLLSLLMATGIALGAGGPIVETTGGKVQGRSGRNNQSYTLNQTGTKTGQAKEPQRAMRSLADRRME
jgi:hypothetical protein